VRRRPASPLRDIPFWPAALPLLLFLALPLLAPALRLDWTQLPATLGSPTLHQALSLSLSTTLISSLLTVVLGMPLALVLARAEFRGRVVLDTLVDLPTVLPPAVAGIALLMTFGRRGLLGETLLLFGISIPYTPLAVILAQLFVAAPFFVRAAAAGIAAVDRELEAAAALDGAGRWQVLRLVTIPLAWPALLSGLVMSWARALGEFGATILFAGNLPGRTQTMPLAIYLGFERDLNLALTLSLLLLFVSFAVLAVVRALLRRRFTLS
jgi:molybdate transport system permease protein